MDIIERLIKEKSGMNSLTVFRKALNNETLGDSAHAQWLRDGTIHIVVQNYVEDLLNETALERIREWA